MVEFVSVRRTARPARVAILVPEPGLLDDPFEQIPWPVLMEGALGWLSRVWGGEAGVVVPVGTDGIHPALLRTLASYDPDFVVSYTPGQRDLSAAGLDARHESLSNWVPAQTPEELEVHLSAPRLDDTFSPYPIFRDATGGWPLTSVFELEDVCDVPPAELAIKDEHKDDRFLPLMAVARFGRLGPREVAEHEGAGRQVDLIALSANEILGYSYQGPGYRRHNPVEQLPFARGTVDSQWYFRGVRRAPLACVVVGDEPGDFALALMLDRMYGPGSSAWLPTEWIDSGDSPAGTARWLAAEMLDDARSSGPRTTQLAVTSITELPFEGAIAALRAASPQMVVTSADETGTPQPSLTELEWTDASALPLAAPRLLVASGAIDLHEALPVEDGTLIAPVAPPLPDLAERTEPGRLLYVADAAIGDTLVPNRFALNGLVTSAGEPEGVRAGRDGVAWSANREFQPGGKLAYEHRLKPLRNARSPGVDEIVAALAAQAGYEALPSNAGRFYAGAVTMWGGLSHLADDLRDPVVYATLQAFLDAGSSRAAPGLVPGNSNRRVLRLSDVRRATGYGLDVEEARGLVDRFVGRGILRRGWCLKCSRCLHAQWYDAEDVGQTFTCGRCRSTHPVDVEAWQVPSHEPTVFYSLDELCRQALEHHMRDVILAVDHLRHAHGHREAPYALATDIRQAGEDRPVTDLDFSVVVDGSLIVGEAKSNGSLGASEKERRKTVAKLAAVASDLTADMVVFATCAEAWGPTSIAAVADEPQLRTWRPTTMFLTGEQLLS